MAGHEAALAPGVVAPSPRQPEPVEMESPAVDTGLKPEVLGSAILDTTGVGIDINLGAVQPQPTTGERTTRGARLWELVQTAQSGTNGERDRALHEFCRETYPYIVHFAHGLIRDWHAAEDMAQEAFIRFTNSLDTIKEIVDSPMSLLFRITRRLAIDYGKSRNYRTLEDPTDDISLHIEQADIICTSPVEEAFERGAISSDITKLLARLDPPILKTIIELRFLEGLTSEETVRELRTTPRMVRNLEARALAMMKELIENSELDIREPAS